MSGAAKITSTHLSRCAHIYVRQSTPSQLERNIESTDRQYALAARAIELGWSRDAVVLIDDDLGVSGSGTADRPGFARMTAEVALGRVGIVLGLEVSRLARNNADWYRLIDLCALTDTLIGDADGVYHPAAFNDRLVLGLKGTMSEAELHVLRARLEGGIRNKAARGELKRGLPVGLVWGEDDGEMLMHPDEAVTGAIATVFARFAELGSVRKVWLWFRQEGLSFPLQKHQQAEIAWVTPSYVQIHHVLTNPAYAGAYAYGKTRRERYVDVGQVRTRLRRLPREEWGVLITDHHKGFIDWPAYEANQARIASNTRPRPHQPGGAVREGCALLQGIACCGRCGRKLAVHYQGRNSTPGYHCPGRELVDGRGQYCMSIGGVQIDRAVAEAFLAALTPAGLDAALAAAEALESNYDASLEQWRLEVERGRYEAERAERRYRAAEPENRLVTRGLEPNGSSACATLPKQKPNSPRAINAGRALSAKTNATRSGRSAATSPGYGAQTPPPTAIARSCCARLSRKSSSRSTASRAGPTSPCAGRAERSPSLRSRSRARSPRSALTRTPSRSSAGSRCTTPTRSSPESSTARGASARPARDSPR
jgi:DNA invertase Pin-like site-specific DNA recombinase